MDEDLKRLLNDTALETRRHFDVVADGIEKKVDLVAEALVSLSRVQGELRSDMGRGFEETQAMIRLSYAELDRRLRTVEGDVEDLRSRLQRLESSAH